MQVEVISNLKRIRESRGVEVQTIADDLQISRSEIYNLQNNQSCPNLSVAALLAAYFDMTIDEIFEWRVVNNEKRRLGRTKRVISTSPQIVRTSAA